MGAEPEMTRRAANGLKLPLFVFSCALVFFCRKCDDIEDRMIVELHDCTENAFVFVQMHYGLRFSFCKWHLPANGRHLLYS
jgi:hypothetical protein